MTVVGYDVKGIDDIGVLESGTHAKLGSNLFLILFFTLARTFRSKLFGSINRTTILGASLYEADCSSSASTEDTAQLAVLF
jgi:hypothetical protein